jgi:thiol-disulfide isomerase/thioredoxin
VERAAAGLLRTTRSASQPPTFQIASLYLQRNIHLNEIPELVKKGLDDLDKSSSIASSDLFPAGSGPQSMRFNTRLSGLNTLTDAYLKAHQPAKALEVLADVRKTLDQNKPSDSANDNDRHNWSRLDASYWDKMGRIAEDQGRKLEALTFYQNLIRGGSSIGNQEYIRRKARVLWIDLGGTDTGWEAWLTNSAPARPIAPAVVATASTGWEKLNKPMPDFELPDMTGKTWRLTDLRGKTTLINVWATWCGPCKMELPQLQKLYEKLKNRDDIRIITLNTDDNPGVIESFLRETQYTFPVLPARAYVDKLIPSLSIPRNWIVDRDAILRLESVGYGGDGDKWVDSIIETIKEWQ